MTVAAIGGGAWVQLLLQRAEECEGVLMGNKHELITPHASAPMTLCILAVSTPLIVCKHAMI